MKCIRLVLTNQSVKANTEPVYSRTDFYFFNVAPIDNTKSLSTGSTIIDYTKF